MRISKRAAGHHSYTWRILIPAPGICNSFTLAFISVWRPQIQISPITLGSKSHPAQLLTPLGTQLPEFSARTELENLFQSSEILAFHELLVRCRKKPFPFSLECAHVAPSLTQLLGWGDAVVEGEYWSSELQWGLGIRKSLFSSPVISIESFLQTELSVWHRVQQDFSWAAWGGLIKLPRSVCGMVQVFSPCLCLPPTLLIKVSRADKLLWNIWNWSLGAFSGSSSFLAHFVQLRKEHSNPGSWNGWVHQRNN